MTDLKIVQFLEKFKSLGQFSFTFHNKKDRTDQVIARIKLTMEESKYVWTGENADKSIALGLALDRAETDLVKIRNGTL